jgi:putative RNA 2'-phosphotransferase
MSKQSKFLALILRHRPEKGNLVLDEQGWADVVAVLKAVSLSRAELEQLVEDDDKTRFSFNEDGTRIRANQGHSVQSIDLGLQPVDPPTLLYHGTKEKSLDSIQRDGLKPGERQHVHLSGDIDTATTVASRRSGDSVILIIQAGELAARGHSFYRSDNGVWLTDTVPPAYLTAFIDKK